MSRRQAKKILRRYEGDAILKLALGRGFHVFDDVRSPWRGYAKASAKWGGDEWRAARAWGRWSPAKPAMRRRGRVRSRAFAERIKAMVEVALAKERAT